MLDPNKLLNIYQVGEYIGVSRSTIERMLVDGDIAQPDFLVSQVKKRMWKLGTITKWLDEKCANPRKEKTV